jgi:hypothetical protein
LKIISRFHDYYDSAMGYGADPLLTYRRVPECVEVNSWQWDGRIPDILNCRPSTYCYRSNLSVLGFCGKCYPIWLKSAFNPTVETLGRDTPEVARLTLDELIEEGLESYFEHLSRTGYSRGSFQRTRESVRASFEAAYNEAAKMHGVSIDDKVFRDLRCPVFIASSRVDWRGTRMQEYKAMIITNPRLATLGFQQELDAFSTFQELSMFLGSALATEPFVPNTVGDDGLVARSKGFDEHSFRTAAPGAKKANRKRNKDAKKRRREE